MPLSQINKDLEKYFKQKFTLELIDIPSMNDVYLVKCNHKKYALKLYYDEGKGFFLSKDSFKESYDNELLAYTKFNMNELGKVYLHKKRKNYAFILRDFKEGTQLKNYKSFKLYKKAVDLMLKLHEVRLKCNCSKLKRSYEVRINEQLKRIEAYLPEKYKKEELINKIKTIKKQFPKTCDVKNSLLHGDYVDRNILVDKENICLVDFENSRIGPVEEDLAFFLTSINLSQEKKQELLNYYIKKSNYFKKERYNLVLLLAKIRFFGMFLKLNQLNLNKYDSKIKKDIKEIKRLYNLVK
ncbi:aminoglycoside phosphotransferase family protein [Candidatus Woesearchaeota archaeon]|nr:aminoglycoside phosphotransferase family protein [Candidatus Woesearchaeota archaeon]